MLNYHIITSIQHSMSNSMSTTAMMMYDR